MMRRSNCKALCTFVSTCIVVVVSFLVVPVLASNSEKQVVGYVEQVTGGSSGFHIERDGEQVPVTVLTQVLVGDRVVIHTEGLEIFLRLGNDELILVNKQNTPYIVTGTESNISISSNLLSWLKEFVVELKSDESVQTVTLTTRGTSHIARPPKLLLLNQTEHALVRSGERTLRFEWLFGVPPYVGGLYVASDDSLVSEISAGRNNFSITCPKLSTDSSAVTKNVLYQGVIDPVDLKEGDYRVLISDSLGNVGVRSLTVSDKGYHSGTNGQVISQYPSVIQLSEVIKGNLSRYAFDARQSIGDLAIADDLSKTLTSHLLCDSMWEGVY